MHAVDAVAIVKDEAARDLQASVFTIRPTALAGMLQVHIVRVGKASEPFFVQAHEAKAEGTDQLIQLRPTSLSVIGRPQVWAAIRCELFRSCGGVYEGWNCLSKCCGEPERCHMACFRSPNMTKVVRDAEDLGIDRRWDLGQRKQAMWQRSGSPQHFDKQIPALIHASAMIERVRTDGSPNLGSGQSRREKWA